MNNGIFTAEEIYEEIRKNIRDIDELKREYEIVNELDSQHVDDVYLGLTVNLLSDKIALSEDRLKAMMSIRYHKLPLEVDSRCEVLNG
jgi:hypothetical protein